MLFFFISEKGFFMEPTVFTDVEDHMFLAKEESFGPIMVISKFPNGYVLQRPLHRTAPILCDPVTTSFSPDARLA